MKILVAADSFKGSLSSKDFGHIAKTILEKMGHSVDAISLADGGEGTTEALIDNLGGKYISSEVTAPLGEKIKGTFGILDNKTAVMEMAQASGIEFVKGREDPFKATSYGTGELIKSALDHGAEKIIIGIGGSGTNDCGAGALEALGARYYDVVGNILHGCPI